MSGPYRYGRIRPSAAKLASLPLLHAVAAMAQLPAPPAALDFSSLAFYAGMLGNDRAGNCTIAALFGLLQGWSAKTLATPIVATTDEAIALYSQLSGYNPQTGANDTGLVETDVLDYWMKTGVSYAQAGQSAGFNQVKAYATIDPRNVEHLKQSIWVTGSVYLGAELPNTAEQQTAAGQPWSVPWFGYVVGGHAFPAMRYDDNFIYVRTWGQEQPVEWSWWLRYGDAAYAPVDPLWIGQSGKSPDGLDLDAIVADLPYVQD